MQKSIEEKLKLIGILEYRSETKEILHYLKHQKNPKKIEEMIQERSNFRPLSYILGCKNFYGHNFIVDENCLIPRFDSEILIESIIKNLQIHGKKSLKIADICCGSGCLGVSLALEILKIAPRMKITLHFIDISKKALKIAKKNKKNLLKNQTSSRFFAYDIKKMNFLLTFEKYDTIIYNPPYIKTYDIAKLDQQIKDFEPKIALDGGIDGLIFYRIAAEKFQRKLKKNAIITMEIGDDQERDVCEILENKKYQIISKNKDLSGKVRCIIIKSCQEKSVK